MEMDGPCPCPEDTLDDERCCGGAAPFPGLWKRRQLLSWERMEGCREGDIGPEPRRMRKSHREPRKGRRAAESMVCPGKGRWSVQRVRGDAEVAGWLEKHDLGEEKRLSRVPCGISSSPHPLCVSCLL